MYLGDGGTESVRQEQSGQEERSERWDWRQTTKFFSGLCKDFGFSSE